MKELNLKMIYKMEAEWVTHTSLNNDVASGKGGCPYPHAHAHVHAHSISQKISAFCSVPVETLRRAHPLP